MTIPLFNQYIFETQTQALQWCNHLADFWQAPNPKYGQIDQG